VNISIVTDIYPPMIGGAGAVMHSLATCAPNQISIITGEFNSNGDRICCKERQLSTPENVYRVTRLSRNLNWLPKGRLRALCQAAYDRLYLQPRATRDLIRLLNSLSPEAVCIGTLSSCYWAVSAVRKWRQSTQVLIYVHGEEVPQRAGFFPQMRLQALQSASALVAVSAFTKDALIKAGIPSGRITVITNGVDTTRFQPGEKCQRILDRYGLQNRRVLLTLARLDERKGQDMMIKALPLVREAVPDVAYLVVGEGDYRGTLNKLVEDLHLEDTVIFTGAANDAEVADYYLTCDAYVMPNRTTENGDTEGFGLVFLEAGACGKPVIGGMAGGVPDAIVHEVTGLLVDGRCTEQIAHACIRLLENDTLRSVLGANGLVHARENDWRIKTNQFLQFCDTLVNQ
jgi:phosphatidyl-myo-inositol dimannoside synthase